jgi:hypothetical protein
MATKCEKYCDRCKNKIMKPGGYVSMDVYLYLFGGQKDCMMIELCPTCFVQFRDFMKEKPHG